MSPACWMCRSNPGTAGRPPWFWRRRDLDAHLRRRKCETTARLDLTPDSAGSKVFVHLCPPVLVPTPLDDVWPGTALVTEVRVDD